jgi:hypothetical protein
MRVVVDMGRREEGQLTGVLYAVLQNLNAHSPEVGHIIC